MSTAVERDPVAFLAHLGEDARHAQGLLAELATELRRVPVEECTRALHLRALALRRAVTRWAEDHPDETNRRALCDEVVALREEARDWRRVLACGRQIASERWLGD